MLSESYDLSQTLAGVKRKDTKIKYEKGPFVVSYQGSDDQMATLHHHHYIPQIYLNLEMMHHFKTSKKERSVHWLRKTTQMMAINKINHEGIYTGL